MMFFKWAAITLVLALTACTPFGGFKPPPDGWTYYAGRGATQKEIEMVYLECGFPYPGDFREMPREVQAKLGFLDEVEKQNAALANKYYCMKDAGFPIDKLEDPCAVSSRRNDWPACKSDADIPKRSLENRLNSPYCKAYPKTKICQPNYDPSKDDPSPPTNPDSSSKSISIAPSIDPATKLQSQTQTDSNVQMNQLLQSSGSRR
jgi:hypothetical protein